MGVEHQTPGTEHWRKPTCRSTPNTAISYFEGLRATFEETEIEEKP